jgi:hypothetical protein
MPLKPIKLPSSEQEPDWDRLRQISDEAAGLIASKTMNHDEFLRLWQDAIDACGPDGQEFTESILTQCSDFATDEDLGL